MTDQMGDTEMADKPPGEGHNLTKTFEAFADAFPKIFAKEQEIKKLTELHVDDAKGDKKRYWDDLKTITGFDRKYMEAQYRVYKLQEEAKLMEGDDRSNALDAMRITYEAMVKGGQLDFVDALGDTELGQAA